MILARAPNTCDPSRPLHLLLTACGSDGARGHSLEMNLLPGAESRVDQRWLHGARILNMTWGCARRGECQAQQGASRSPEARTGKQGKLRPLFAALPADGRGTIMLQLMASSTGQLP